MTVYLAGFALSQIFYGPLSDRFGRRPVMLVAVSTFLVGSLVCAFSTDLTLMLFGRVIQSLGASAGGAISNAAVRDSFPEEMRTRVFLKVNTIFALAPGVGPIAGSLIDHYLGWQFNFYTSRAIAPFENIVGSASALLGSLSMGLASASTLFVAILPGNSAEVMSIAFTGISGLGVVLTVIAFVFWRDKL
jgi:multidrug resistance protein